MIKNIGHWIGIKRQEMRRKNQFIDNLRTTDTFLVGHPKSGNTWLAYMLGILNQQDYENTVTLANIGEYVPVIHNADGDIAKHGHLQDPRIFRNEACLYPELYPKTIYLMRDPRAALLSYYHHCVHDTENHEWPISDFIDEMLTYGCIKRLEPHLIRWDKQVIEWLDRRKQQAVKVVKYEDLIKDRRQVLQELIDFIGINCDEALLSMAVQRGEFQNMRQEEKTHGAESYKGEKGSKGYFVRKGKADGWKEELPSDAVKKIEQTFYRAMKETGYL